nr:MAG TPA: hypothetical protein [Bacteriophage sp.]
MQNGCARVLDKGSGTQSTADTQVSGCLLCFLILNRQNSPSIR